MPICLRLLCRHIKAVLLCILFSFFLSCCAPTPEQTIQGKTMGTTYQIKLANSSIPAADLKQDIDALLDTINMKMSTYMAESEISRFNSSESTDWQSLSNETFTVTEKAVEVHQNSTGAFDITVGPLVNLWGFGPDKRPSKVPSQASIDSAMAVSGSNF
nr:FAD:protein FMN transferase [Desulfobulbaceae bacterium]